MESQTVDTMSVDAGESSEEPSMVIFYRLIDQDEDKADSLQPCLICPVDLYAQIVAYMPPGDAYAKLVELQTSPEITVEQQDAPTLIPVLDILLEELGYRGSMKAGIDVRDKDFGLHSRMVDWIYRFEREVKDLQEQQILRLVGRKE